MARKLIGPRRGCDIEGCMRACANRRLPGLCSTHARAKSGRPKAVKPLQQFCHCGEPSAVQSWGLCVIHARIHIQQWERERLARSRAALAERGKRRR